MVSRSLASVRSSPSVRAARADLHVGLLSRGGRGPFYVETGRENRYESGRAHRVRALRGRSVLRVFLAQAAPGFQDLPLHGKGGRLNREPISFGTDGVRGVANKGLLPEDALRLGLAASRAFGGRILVGRDTRL